MVLVNVCVSSMYAVGLCPGNNAVGYLTLVFLKAIKEEEKLVIHIKTVPFVLMDSDVCDYSMYSVCALFYF